MRKEVKNYDIRCNAGIAWICNSIVVIYAC
nr:MAG TPA: hypothetical protein [Caudoviricetes sp.]